MFWQRFYNLCKENNVSPTTVVKSIGISHGVITQWKNGTNPNVDALIKISKYFNVSLDYLMCLTDDKFAILPRIDINDLESLTEQDVEKGIVSLKLTGTEEQLDSFKEFLKSRNMRYFESNKEQVTPTEQPVDEIDKEILELTADMTEEEKNSVLGYAARLVAKHKKED